MSGYSYGNDISFPYEYSTCLIRDIVTARWKGAQRPGRTDERFPLTRQDLLASPVPFDTLRERVMQGGMRLRKTFRQKRDRLSTVTLRYTYEIEQYLFR